MGPLSTERLDLVPLRVEHAEEMAEVLSDPTLHEFIGGEPATVEQLRRRYEKQAAGSPDPAVTWVNLVIRLRAENCLAGYVQATVAHRSAEIAWVVGTPWQGRGIASESARALTDWLRSTGVNEIVAHVHPEHAASGAVAAAAGLTQTDTVVDGELRWLWRTTAQVTNAS
ncbi:GNAT family N-acetyltransferase [Allokutzneria sp. A3M-2-11 16]|uniref:GNAT family N-acetyltransferase n=1 Tax=Allokutzneria sp. A3M-2-11 16 TaxID=2962043 RepID=UPI0020B7E044|nr:GNAT family N-acetyltransferase [Allokutzneria sp. A3M-2-11 16]MCP3801736.1 GNAT family N-acetyltransferase [Allokutzneria sp. A3M-2-11 16]